MRFLFYLSCAIFGLYIGAGLRQCTASASEVIRVGVIDTGYADPDKTQLCPDTLATNLVDDDAVQHGTNMARIIMSEAGDRHRYCLKIYKVFGKDGSFDAVAYLTALNDIMATGIQVVNLSMSGYDVVVRESFLVKRLLDLGVIVVAAAGNQGAYMSPKMCMFYPACIDPRIIVVGSRSLKSNIGPVVDFIASGKYNGLQGTSISTARITGRIVKGDNAE